jgi:hypothetical protein
VPRYQDLPELLRDEGFDSFENGSPEEILSPFPFPYLGTTEWAGWDYTGEKWFVDASGFGTDHEPALSARQFPGTARIGACTHA